MVGSGLPFSGRPFAPGTAGLRSCRLWQSYTQTVEEGVEISGFQPHIYFHDASQTVNGAIAHQCEQSDAGPGKSGYVQVVGDVELRKNPRTFVLNTLIFSLPLQGS